MLDSSSRNLRIIGSLTQPGFCESFALPTGLQIQFLLTITIIQEFNRVSVSAGAARVRVDTLEDHVRELIVVDASVAVRVGIGNHLLHLVVGELLAKVHHAMLELCFAYEAVTVAVEHPVGGRMEACLRARNKLISREQMF